MRGSSSREGQNRGPFCPARSRGGRYDVFISAPQGAPAPGPWWGHSSGLLWQFSSPEGREKSPKTGARQRGHLRGPARPHVPGAGLEGACVAPFWRPLQGARAAACNSAINWRKVCAGRCFEILLRAARFPISHIPLQCCAVRPCMPGCQPRGFSLYSTCWVATGRVNFCYGHVPPVLVFTTGSLVSHFPFRIIMLYSTALCAGLPTPGV